MKNPNAAWLKVTGGDPVCLKKALAIVERGLANTVSDRLGLLLIKRLKDDKETITNLLELLGVEKETESGAVSQEAAHNK